MTFRRLVARCLATVATAALCCVPSVGHADVKLAAIFGDNMVLQAGQNVPVWGTAEPGEEIEVRITVSKDDSPVASDSPIPETDTQEKRTRAGDDGRWSVTLDPMPPTENPVGLVITGNNKLTLENVLVGEVWVCSGQSNMEWSINRSANPQEEIANAKHPRIRLYQVKKQVAANQPLSDTEGQWVECSPETIPNFSAVAYFFGREIQKRTGRPVGLIQTAWGGTPAEAWTSRDKLEQAGFDVILNRWKENVEKDSKALDNPHHPAGLFNGMIAPIIPYAIQGAIWYQGESNAGRAYQYRELFPTMITDWRERWNQGDFPFLFVQLANFKPRQDQPGDSDWAELREAQSLTLDLPKTGQAVTIDIGEAGDIHPRNKQDVGKRLALSAMHVAYGDEEIVHSGPTYATPGSSEGISRDGNEITIRFENVGGGLVAKGGELKGFAVADSDKQWHWAEARIEGDTVVVSSPDVEQPVAVRYAWADNPEATLYNAEGLPASPFRTDDWKGVTADRK